LTPRSRKADSNRWSLLEKERAIRAALIAIVSRLPWQVRNRRIPAGDYTSPAFMTIKLSLNYLNESDH